MCARSGPSAGKRLRAAERDPGRERLAGHLGRRAHSVEDLVNGVAVPVETAARTAPPSRSRRVIARVSIPWRPTTPSLGQPVGEPRPVARRGVSALADDDGAGMRAVRLGRVRLDAVVSDHAAG